MVDAACAELSEIAGSENVIFDVDGLERYTWDTLPVNRRFRGVVKPSSVEEVQRLVALANRCRLPLYPISTGNNWGYGSALPTRDGALIVDLSRMNRVLEVNTELAYAVVEPGVTQQSLYDHLKSRGIPLWLNPTGAGPSCSILGNTLERGFGIGPNGDHFQALCGMEVVLGNGDTLHTGFGHYPGAKATSVYKYGVGPYLDGLFTQSNYGIVTKIGLWLAPEPERFEACYFTCHSEDQLSDLIDAVRKLLFQGVFQGPLNLLHRDRLLIMLDRYPWNEMDGRTPLDPAVAARLASAKKIGVWNGVGAICGSAAQVRAAKATIKRALRGKIDRLTFLSDSRLDVLRRFPKVFSGVLGLDVPSLLKTLENSYGMMKGIPSEIALSLAYWRNRHTPFPATNINPARDQCGLMWFAPIIPMTFRDVSAFRSIAQTILTRFGFETCITLTAVNERCFDCTLPILFDRQNPEELRKANECYMELIERCATEGYLAYRFGLQSMEREVRDSDVFWRTSGRLKNALDPNGIIAPGRYAP